MGTQRWKELIFAFFVIFSIKVCNNELVSHRGVIESPNFPNPYPHNRNCTWQISAPLGNTVNITFSHFELENSHPRSNDCVYDFLEVKEASVSDVRPSIGKVTVGEEPPLIFLVWPSSDSSRGSNEYASTLWIRTRPGSSSISHNQKIRICHVQIGCFRLNEWFPFGVRDQWMRRALSPPIWILHLAQLSPSVSNQYRVCLVHHHRSRNQHWAYRGRIWHGRPSTMPIWLPNRLWRSRWHLASTDQAVPIVSTECHGDCVGKPYDDTFSKRQFDRGQRIQRQVQVQSRR